MSSARDRYEQHYTEKIWDRIPEMYRDQDGRPATTSDRGGQHQLRALVEVLAGQAAVLRRSVDRVWDDEFIDLCDDWAVPYLGDLVATRMVSALDKRARRVDVANTVYYRRRAGTLRVLEELVGDITGWEGVVVEQFQRLGRAWHGLDPLPGTRLGPMTGTPRGGSADLRRPVGAQRAGGPFDEFAHSADVRRHAGTSGRYAIPKLAFQLYRLGSLPVVQTRPTRAVNARSFTLDPLGRDQPLFARADRPLSFDDWTRLSPWQVPAPISCQLLNHAEFSLTPRAVARVTGGGLGLSLGAIADLESLRGDSYRSAAALRTALAATGSGAELVADPVRNAIEAAAIIEDCGKWGLLSADDARSPSLRIEIGGVTVPPEQIVAGDLSVWRDPPAGRRVIVDPARGRLRFASAPGASLRVDFHVGLVGPVGATPHSRSPIASPTDPVAGGGTLPALVDGTVVEITDSLNYELSGSVAVPTSLAIVARDRERPYLDTSAGNVIFDSGAAVDASLILDGLWLGGGNDVVIRGDFASVRLRRCTLDPGTAVAGDGVGLRIEGNIGTLLIERSIVGPLAVSPTAIVGTIEVADSVLEPADRADPASAAVAASRTTLDIARSTVLGAVTALRLWATDCLFVRPVTIADTQAGCFRFSAAPVGSRIPHPYESTTTPGQALFTTRDSWRPGYVQLLASAGPGIMRGAETTSQMGAYSSALEPIVFDSLTTKVAEYLPIGRLPIYTFVT